MKSAVTPLVPTPFGPSPMAAGDGEVPDGPGHGLHTRHILPPSEIDLGLCLAVFAGSEGNIYFTELAERIEYGNYGLVGHAQEAVGDLVHGLLLPALLPGGGVHLLR